MQTFGIAGPNKECKSLHLVITYKYGQIPVLGTLVEQFGKEIGKFTEFVKGVEHPRFVLLSVASSGDGIYNSQDSPDEFGSLGIFAYEKTKKHHFVSSCYHVIFRGALPENTREAYNTLRDDFDNELSDTRNASFCHRTGEGGEGEEGEGQIVNFATSQINGTFRAKFNEEHDFALLQVLDGFELKHTSIEDINSNVLMSNAEIVRRLEEKGEDGELLVKKTGCRTGTTWGILKQCGYAAGGFNYKNGYLIENKDSNEPFAAPGDSGSLVKVKLDDKGSFGAFAYVVADIGDSKFFCFNFKNSFELFSDLDPCLMECQEEN